MPLPQLSFVFALALTTSAIAGELVSDDVFARAAVELRQTIKTSGTDQAALLVEECYRQAKEQENVFGPIHIACVTKDYLLTSVLALPYDRDCWWPPKNRANRYDVMAPALQSRIANLHTFLNTPPEIVDDARRRMFFVGVEAFKEECPASLDK